MPRAPFDISVTFVQGPGAAAPGSVRWAGPARYVAADGIFQYGPGAPSIVGWITFDTGAPVGAWVPDKLGLDPTLSDQVIVGSGDPTHFVLWVEHVLWGDADYFRASIAELPLPEACDCSAAPPPPWPIISVTGAPSGPIHLPPGFYTLEMDPPTFGTVYTNCSSGTTNIYYGSDHSVGALITSGGAVSWSTGGEATFILEVVTDVYDWFVYVF